MTFQLNTLLDHLTEMIQMIFAKHCGEIKEKNQDLCEYTILRSHC